MTNATSEGPASYIPRVDLADFTYDLPADRIAAHPLANRDASRLLVCEAPGGTISHHHFTDLPSLLPGGTLLLMNATRVVRARILMHRATGGRVELFVLEPAGTVHDPARALAQTAEAEWLCMVRGAGKLEREGKLAGEFLRAQGAPLVLHAALHERREDGFAIRFRWEPTALTFAEVLETVGRVPLPPYIRREATMEDAATYQTVYAREEGAVAAPTAGLHFTPELLGALGASGIRTAELVLHVGAGTFKQVKGDVVHHVMHEEYIAVPAATLRTLIEQQSRRAAGSGTAPLVVVGTTTLRTLETLYWLGVRLIAGESVDDTGLLVGQWDPYRLAAPHAPLPGPGEALQAVEQWRAAQDMPAVTGRTGIMIVPGYTVKLCDALITNFHQPESTLLLLVGALLGRDLWHRVYTEALENGYRFLSYGDSSMLVLGREGRERSEE